MQTHRGYPLHVYLFVFYLKKKQAELKTDRHLPFFSVLEIGNKLCKFRL